MGLAAMVESMRLGYPGQVIARHPEATADPPTAYDRGLVSARARLGWCLLVLAVMFTAIGAVLYVRSQVSDSEMTAALFKCTALEKSGQGCDVPSESLTSAWIMFGAAVMFAVLGGFALLLNAAPPTRRRPPPRPDPEMPGRPLRSVR